MLNDKYVGLTLAIASGVGIGSSIVVTKKGLDTARQRHGFKGTGHEYLKAPIWWLGMILMAMGEFANFAAYAFAPAVLVTPLGALSVLVGAVLGSYILNERLGPLGKIGCAISLIGSIVIVLHAPPDKDVQTVDEILEYALKPGKYYRLLYSFKANIIWSVSYILHFRDRLFSDHDIPCCTKIRQDKSTLLPLDMRQCWLSLCYVYKGVWDSIETYFKRGEPIYTSLNICVRDCHNRGNIDADELF